jgi:hypothetical protein
LARCLPRLCAFVRIRAGDLVLDKETANDVAPSVFREVLADLPDLEYRGEAAFLTSCWCTLVQRHRGRFAAAVTATVLLAAGVFGTATGWVDARARAREAEQANTNFQRLAGVLELQRAVASERELYPAWPEMAPQLEQWLAESGEPLARMLPDIDATLARLAAAETPSGADRFLRERLAWARQVRAETVDRHADAWQRAFDEVARAAEYAGLVLTPQLDLVPLGRDPASGLQEFAHSSSGSIPRRDPATGRLVLDDDSGIVFVLLPGSEFVMVAQRSDPTGPNFDPSAWDLEGPPHRVALGPYFLAKSRRRARSGSDAPAPRTRAGSRRNAATSPAPVRSRASRGATATGCCGSTPWFCRPRRNGSMPAVPVSARRGTQARWTSRWAATPTSPTARTRPCPPGPPTKPGQTTTMASWRSHPDRHCSPTRSVCTACTATWPNGCATGTRSTSDPRGPATACANRRPSPARNG